MSDKAKIDFTSLLLALSPVSILTLEETVRRFRRAYEQSKEPSNEIQQSNNDIDLDIDPNYVAPSTLEMPAVTSLLDDVTKIQNRKRSRPAPTLATGRRNLKSEHVSEEEASKRQKRRNSNRLSAQRSREKRNQMSNKLEVEKKRLEKANEILEQRAKVFRDLIMTIESQHRRCSCGLAHENPAAVAATSSRSQCTIPLSQPMSASSCGSDLPVSNTSQGLTPPPALNEDLMIKHSPPDSFDHPPPVAAALQVPQRPATLNIPVVPSMTVSDHSYLDQLRLPDQPIQSSVPSTYFSTTTFTDNLSTPVLSYGYNNMDYGGHADLNGVMPPMTDTDSMHLA